MKIAVVEDDENTSKQINEYFKILEHESGIAFEVSVFKNGIIFLTNYKPSYDMVLMDIQMPYMNGMDVAKKMRESDSKTALLFVTNMAQFAIKGYEVNALDFIVKPLNYKNFAMRINSALTYIKNHAESEIIINTTDNVAVKLGIHDIKYISVSGHYLTYHTINGDYTVRGNINNIFQEYFPYGFIRCSNCYLLNPKYITFIGKNSLFIDDTELSFGRARKKELLFELANYFDNDI